MYNRGAVYMLVIYLCADGDAVCDETETQIQCLCGGFMFYSIWLLPEKCQIEQTRNIG